METDEERKARLEKTVATTQLRLAMETEEERRANWSFKKQIFYMNEVARPVMGTIFLVVEWYMAEVIDDTLCGCRFVLRFRRESKLKSEAAYCFTQIVRPVGWGGVWCSVWKAKWVSVICSI